MSVAIAKSRKGCNNRANAMLDRYMPKGISRMPTFIVYYQYYMPSGIGCSHFDHLCKNIYYLHENFNHSSRC